MQAPNQQILSQNSYITAASLNPSTLLLGPVDPLGCLLTGPLPQQIAGTLGFLFKAKDVIRLHVRESQAAVLGTFVGMV